MPQNETTLYSPITIGDVELKNRIIMAPLTRSRASKDGRVPTDLMAEYYSQRATAGLIITEATQISQQGIGYIQTPGIHTDEQIEGWKKITKAVHDKGGKIFLQLWHVGRISHEFFQPDNQKPVAPSAVKPDAQAYTDQGMQDCPTPRALEVSEIKDIIKQYAQAAQNAMGAGFDGVEIHAANGYLIDQFLRDGANKREDEYGGSIENRCRFALEIVEAITNQIGSGKVGIRISPTSTFNDMKDTNPLETFSYLAEKLNDFNLAYLHEVEPLPDHGMMHLQEDTTRTAGKLHKIFKGPFMINGGYNKEAGMQALIDGYADLVSYGTPFIANPDLVERFKKGAELNKPDPNTFYGGDERGYTDYPFLGDKQNAA